MRYIYIYYGFGLFFENLFLDQHHRDKQYLLFGWFFGTVVFDQDQLQKVDHKNARIFLPYVPPSLSSAAYLPLPLPTTTCRCLPLPATKSLPATTCNYLLRPATTSTYHYLPLPAAACQGLPLPVSI